MLQISEVFKTSEILRPAASGTAPDGIALSLGSIPRKLLSMATLARDCGQEKEFGRIITPGSFIRIILRPEKTNHENEGEGSHPACRGGAEVRYQNPTGRATPPPPRSPRWSEVRKQKRGVIGG